jgi:hypothetical protein
MLISNSRRFLFIHIYKNAGTSISHALSPYAFSKVEKIANRISTGVGQKKVFNSSPYPIHITASQLIDALGKKKYSSYFAFAFVRNPWDWQVSLYNYMLKNTDHYQHPLVSELGGFTDYIHWRSEIGFHLQRDFIFNNDELLVDYVGRFESLNSDFQEISRRIGIQASLPMLNVSNSTPYRNFYTDETRDLVAKMFSPDIRQFGYEF